MLVELLLLASGLYACKVLLESCTYYVLGQSNTTNAHFHVVFVSKYYSVDSIIDNIAPIDTSKYDEECSICLESLRDKEVRKTICGHAYCSDCIERWLNVRMKCPNCNNEFLCHESTHTL